MVPVFQARGRSHKMVQRETVAALVMCAMACAVAIGVSYAQSPKQHGAIVHHDLDVIVQYGVQRLKQVIVHRLNEEFGRLDSHDTGPRHGTPIRSADDCIDLEDMVLVGVNRVKQAMYERMSTELADLVNKKG